MKWVNRFIIVFAGFLVVALIGTLVYKELTKDYYICEKCPAGENKHYPDLEGKGDQYKNIWLCPDCSSRLQLEAGRALGLGNLEDGDPLEVRNAARRKWIYNEGKR